MAKQAISITTSEGHQTQIDPEKSGEFTIGSFSINWKLATTPDLVMTSISLTLTRPLSTSVSSSKRTSAFLIFPTAQSFPYSQASLPDDVIHKGQFQFAFVPSIDMKLKLNAGSYTFFSFQFTPKMLNTWMPEPIIRDLLEHMNKRKPALINARPMEVTPQMSNVLNELQERKFTEKRFGLLLESRALDLLRLALDELNPSTLVYSTPLKPDDVEKIRKVRDYIDGKLDEPLSLKEVAESGGISESKLKTGFKEFYHTTVFDYIRSQRLQRARTQLIDTHLDLKVIARKAGYRSVSNFSSAFKKAFTCSPTSLRRS
jgi:AraC-like DNA-binding protein